MGKRGKLANPYKPNQYNTSDWNVLVTGKKFYIEKQIERCDKSELNKTIDNNIVDDVVFNKIYARKNNEWIHIGSRCTSCDKTFKSQKVIDKHKNLCKRINTNNKEDKFMPIQKITKNGETYYRWGDTGKLYRNRADAEKQAAAAYASGYKSKDMNGMKEKK